MEKKIGFIYVMAKVSHSIICDRFAGFTQTLASSLALLNIPFFIEQTEKSLQSINKITSLPCLKPSNDFLLQPGQNAGSQSASL